MSLMQKKKKKVLKINSKKVNSKLPVQQANGELNSYSRNFHLEGNSELYHLIRAEAMGGRQTSPNCAGSCQHLNFQAVTESLPTEEEHSLQIISRNDDGEAFWGKGLRGSWWICVTQWSLFSMWAINNWAPYTRTGYRCVSGCCK